MHAESAARAGENMPTQHAIDEADIRQRISRWAEAVRAMDVERVMPIYAADVVSFDVEAPLQYKGSAAKRKRWESVFAMYRRPLDYEIRDLAITLGEDVAFGHSLNRISGTLQNGSDTGFWLRWTPCFRKID